MFRYEFIEVENWRGLTAGKTDTFNKCKDIINEKAKEGWELVQIFPVVSEKAKTFILLNYTLVFKVEE